MLKRQLFYDTIEKLNLDVDAETYEKLDIYAETLIEENKKYNLTAITEPDDITIKHFADSVSLLASVDIKAGSSLIDVGTGAGFPGLVLKIARPDIKLTFLDAREKKLLFISKILEKLNLEAEILHARAEEAGQDKRYREKFDFATARAVSSLDILSEYCLPFVKPGGIFISMKSSNIEEETEKAKRNIWLLGGSIDRIHEFELAGNKRSNIIILKTEKTDDKYPRTASRIKKKQI